MESAIGIARIDHREPALRAKKCAQAKRRMNKRLERYRTPKKSEIVPGIE